MTIKHLAAAVAIFAVGFACEKEYIPNLPTTAADIVVEGYIEAGNKAAPPYVILTKSLPFFRDLKNYNDLFVRGATVWVSNGKDSVRLQEFCWADLDPSVKKQAATLFGINADSVAANFNFCVYIDLAQRMKGEFNKTYTLRITTADGQKLSATTTIPRPVPIDSATFIKPPGNNNLDTMAQMRAIAVDPIGPDFYRYFTSTKGSSYVAGANSVTDDAFFDGKVTKFNLLKSEPRDGSTPADLYGLFHRGDSISIKFTTIDKAHFDFWRTLEYNANSGGPFASYTKVKHNIVGGLGIWGGYAATYFDTVVPLK